MNTTGGDPKNNFHIEGNNKFGLSVDKLIKNKR